MNKKIGMILGGVGLVVVILLIFLLSGSSTRDMVIGKWEYRDNRIMEFHDDGTITRYKVRDGGRLEKRDEKKLTWVLSDDEKIITITGGPRKEAIIIQSIDNDKFCGKSDKSGDVRCMSKYSE